MDPDSDDEQIPDAPVIKLFADSELFLIENLYESLCKAYQVGRGVGFYNAAGKHFIQALVPFLQRSTNLSPFKCLCSTATGEYQPGAMSIRWVTPPKNNTRGSSRQVVTVRDRYADVVIYDVVNRVTVAVFEIKEDERAAITAQHNEQMLGLWTSAGDVGVRNAWEQCKHTKNSPEEGGRDAHVHF